MAASRYHHGNLREALVGAAVIAVRERGAQAVALRDLARRVGVSHNAAYRHFARREDLLAEVAGRIMDQLVATMQRRLDRVVADDAVLQARRRLAETGRAYVEFALAEPGLFQLALSSFDGTADASRPGPYLILTRVLDDLVDVGFLSAEARVGAEVACWSAVHGFSVLTIDGSIGGEVEVALEDVLATIDRSYAATTGSVVGTADLRRD